jgi:serine protease Do
MSLETAMPRRCRAGGRRPVWCGLCIAVHLLVAAVCAEESDLSGLEEQAVRHAVATVAPAIVRIETIGGVERTGDLLLGEGPTTGLVVGAEGWIISSAFNFLRQPASILIALPDENRIPARIVARDHSRMLVLLKANVTQPLPVPVAVLPAELAVGQWTIAVGRTLSLQDPNLSVGVLSAANRIWGKAVQTDAKVSPGNYGGALVDIRGRVIGVLVPMSPDGQDEVAGAEWYDSGIGFAVPLTDIQRRLPSLQSGRDIHAGLTGVTLREGEVHSAPAEIAAVQVNSPAFQAGLRMNDTIVGVDGQSVATQAQLKHLLGPRDAGETVRVAVMRGANRLEASLTLVDRLLPYDHPFIGFLPLRRGADRGGEIVVRYVFPNSGAAQAGLEPGDRLVSLDGKPVSGEDSLRLDVANRQPGQVVALGVERGREQRTFEIKLSSLPTAIPPTLPAARSPEPGAPGAGKARLSEFKIVEEPNPCVVLIPEDYSPQKSYGLVVHLPAPGEFDRDAFAQQWHVPLSQHDLIVLAPQAAGPAGWQSTEVEVIRKALDHVLANYAIDRNRIVTYGYQASGTMAALVAFRHRDVVRGLAIHDAGLPRQIRLPDTDPIQRLAVLVMRAAESRVSERMDAAAKLLVERKYPVTITQIAGPPRQLNAEEMGEFVRWVDCLDRI